jgi:hypothetical protein
MTFAIADQRAGRIALRNRELLPRIGGLRQWRSWAAGYGFA